VDEGLADHVHVLREVRLSGHRRGRGDGAHSYGGVLQSKPSREIAGITASDCHDFARRGGQVLLQEPDEASQVSERLEREDCSVAIIFELPEKNYYLVRGQVLEIFCARVDGRKGLAVEAVL
jgi:hypothetical protein